MALDTSGEIDCPRLYNDGPCICGKNRWGQLTSFTQGYVEALFASIPNEARTYEGFAARGHRPIAFSDLAPETLARIIADCAAFVKEYPGWDHRDGGRLFWASRQGGATGWPAYMSEGFPPLTVLLGDDGKVRFA